MAIQEQVPATIDSRTLREWLNSGKDITLVDVRTPAEFESVHIPGSYNVPLDMLDEHRAELHRLAHPLVLICRSGNRATQAERSLAALGPPNVTVLEGGMIAWQEIGGEVRTVRPRWDLERQVRLLAGSLVLAGILASIKFEPAKWLAGFVGGGLTVAALTNTCTMGTLLSKLPYNRSATCNVGAVIAEIARDQKGRGTP